MKISNKSKYDKLWQLAVCYIASNRCQLNYDENCTYMAYNGAHHLVPRKNLNYRFDMNNGFAVCPSCHQWIEEHPKEFDTIIQTMYPSVRLFLDSAIERNANEEIINEQIARLEDYCRLNGLQPSN